MFLQVLPNYNTQKSAVSAVSIMYACTTILQSK
jgi:hypothetical protein